MKPIIDKAEVAIDFPDKTYYGTFSRDSGFDVACDAEQMRLKLSHPGVDQRVAELHLHYYLLADILAAMAQAFTEAPPVDDAHRGELLSATATLQKALRSRRPKSRNRARTGRAA